MYESSLKTNCQGRLDIEETKRRLKYVRGKVECEGAKKLMGLIQGYINRAECKIKIYEENFSNPALEAAQKALEILTKLHTR